MVVCFIVGEIKYINNVYSGVGVAIKSFKSKALKLFWMNDDTSKVKQSHIDSINDILTAIEASHAPRDLKQSFSSFDEKKGGGIGTFTIKVNGNWRITF